METFYSQTTRWLTRLVAVLAAGYLGSASAALTHRYSFTGSGDATDSIGGANGILINGATTSSGQLVLANSGFGSGTNVQHVRLPGGVLPTAGGVTTIEEWFTTSTSGSWVRGFDFGSDPEHSFYFTPHTGLNNTSVRIEQLSGMFISGVSLPPLNNGSPHMLAVVMSDFANLMSVYVDGAFAASATLPAGIFGSLNDSLNYLGASRYADPGFTGTIDEFRIFNTALAVGDIAQHFALGPDVVPEPGSVGLLLIGGVALWLRRFRR